MAFAFGLLFLVMIVLSAPSRLSDDTSFLPILFLVRDVVALFGIFSYSTAWLDKNIRFKFWSLTTGLIILLYLCGLVIDMLDSPMPGLGVFLLTTLLFAVIVGPAILINIVYAIRLKKIQENKTETKIAG